jgi:hypothetical protein
MLAWALTENIGGLQQRAVCKVSCFKTVHNAREGLGACFASTTLFFAAEI